MAWRHTRVALSPLALRQPALRPSHNVFNSTIGVHCSAAGSSMAQGRSILIAAPKTGSELARAAAQRCRQIRRCWQSHQSAPSNGAASSPAAPDLVHEEAQRLMPSMEELGLREGDRVTVAASGGVDSSVALAILSQMPVEIDVVFMRNWDPLLSESPTTASSASSSLPLHDLAYSSTSPATAGKSVCSWETDYRDVQSVCQHLRIPPAKVRLMDFSKEYWSRVFEPSVAVWEAGGTPNPDVACNREIKFGALLDAIIPEFRTNTSSSRHFLATGHYARVKHTPDTALVRAVDETKDQSYYLSAVTERQLARMITPLGGIHKKDVRRLARYFGLPTAERAESMGVCFIGERGKFGDFISQYTQPGRAPGHLVLADGTVLGTHKGLWHFTIGQRARVAGQDQALFVAKKGLGSLENDVLLVPGSDHPALQIKQLRTSTFHTNVSTPLELFGYPRNVNLQIRHRMKAVSAEVRLLDNASASGKGLLCELETPVTGVAPGQVAAVYLGDQCVGSGVIEETRSEEDVADESLALWMGQTGNGLGMAPACATLT